MTATDKEQTMNDLNLSELRRANDERCKLWSNGTEFPLEFRLIELAGEAGEACNEGKKLARAKNGWAGGKTDLAALADELADVVICADLAAMTAGIDLSAAIIAKFNKTSDKHGFPIKLCNLLPPAEAEKGSEWQLTPSFVSANVCVMRKTVYGTDEYLRPNGTVSDLPYWYGTDGKKAAQQAIDAFNARDEHRRKGEADPNICPDCGRKKARSAVGAMAGKCPKWWAIYDQSADNDCDRVRTSRKSADVQKTGEAKRVLIRDGEVLIYQLLHMTPDGAFLSRIGSVAEHVNHEDHIHFITADAMCARGMEQSTDDGGTWRKCTQASK